MPLKILVVDDDPQMGNDMRETLQSQGYQVVLATCGEQGLQRVAQEQPDLVVLDDGLPDTSCGEFMKRLGGTGNVHRPRVLALTLPSFHGGLQDPDTIADWYHPRSEIAHWPHLLPTLVKRILGPPPPKTVYELA